ncbi:hypothetical protein CHUAL_005415 [Chamberlinius hualienensis]
MCCCLSMYGFCFPFKLLIDEDDYLSINIQFTMDGVVKSGYLKKLKYIRDWHTKTARIFSHQTLKKKFFVLKAESESGPARLEYHDNEKKWKTGVQPKRAINLKTCFDINRRMDTRYQWMIALYTKDDCFAFVLESEHELEDWLSSLLQLQHGDDWTGLSEKPKPNFEHVWEVNVVNRGLGNTKGLTGICRLCLTERTLTLVKVGKRQQAAYEFPMMSIRRCGHSNEYFFMEVGRSSSTGQGEFWMETEDELIAQNMHETVLNVMKSSKSKEDLGPKQLIRSQSAATDLKKPTKPIISNHGRRQTFNVTTLEASSQQFPPHSVRERCDSMPTRTRTISDGHKEATVDISSRSHKTLYSRTMSCSPPFSFPPSGFGSYLGEMSNSVSSVESNSGCHPSDVLHVTNVQESIEEEGSPYMAMSIDPTEGSSGITEEGYMEMQPCANSPALPPPSFPSSSRSVSSVISQPFHHPPNWLAISNQTSSIPTTDYLEMSSPTNAVSSSIVHPPVETPDGYMPMSPIGSQLSQDGKIKSGNIHEQTTTKTATGVEGYVPMAPLYDSLPVPLHPTKATSSSDDEGYMDMAPLNSKTANHNRDSANIKTSSSNQLELSSCSRRSSDSPSADLCFAEYPLDKVQAYFTPCEEDEPMVRACSIGSRADCNIKNNRLEVLTADSYRTRAFSVGANVKRGTGTVGSKLNYGVQKGKGRLQQTVTNENGESEVTATPGNGGGKKSMSAPVLGTSPLLNSIWQPSISYGKKNPNEDLMEMDFPESHQSSSSIASSGSTSHRPRVNSKSSHISATTSASTANQQLQKKKLVSPAQEMPMKASDYLIMEASTRKLSLGDDMTSSGVGNDRKSSLPINIDNKRTSRQSAAELENSDEYVNIDLSKNHNGGSVTLPGLIPSARFNPEYANLQYGMDKIAAKSISVVEKSKQDETESDYTVMAPLACSQAMFDSLESTTETSSAAKTFDNDELVEDDNEERQLNYAALDLPPSTSPTVTLSDEIEGKNSPVTPPVVNRDSIDDSVTSSPVANQTNSFYAQIDFIKSEELKTQTQN